MINKTKIFWVSSIPCLYALLTITSASQPFIPSDSYLISLKLWIFPILLLTYYYFIFIKKDKKSKKSKFQKNFQKKTIGYSKTKKNLTKILYIVGIHISSPIMFIVLLYVAQWYPAWPVKYLANQQVIFKASVIKLGHIRKSNQTKIYLQETLTKRNFNLHWSIEVRRQLKVGDILELKANKNWFGIYVNQVTRIDIL